MEVFWFDPPPPIPYFPSTEFIIISWAQLMWLCLHVLSANASCIIV